MLLLVGRWVGNATGRRRCRLATPHGRPAARHGDAASSRRRRRHVRPRERSRMEYVLSSPRRRHVRRVLRAAAPRRRRGAGQARVRRARWRRWPSQAYASLCGAPPSSRRRKRRSHVHTLMGDGVGRQVEQARTGARWWWWSAYGPSQQEEARGAHGGAARHGHAGREENARRPCWRGIGDGAGTWRAPAG